MLESGWNRPGAPYLSTRRYSTRSSHWYTLQVRVDQNGFATDRQPYFTQLECMQLNQLSVTFDKLPSMCNQTSTFVYQAGLLKAWQLCRVSPVYAPITTRSFDLFAG